MTILTAQKTTKRFGGLIALKPEKSSSTTTPWLVCFLTELSVWELHEPIRIFASFQTLQQ
jgi:hypothetical protein